MALIESFGVRSIVFMGVTGGIGQGVSVGDVVIARQFLKHNMDASPIFPRWEISGYGCSTLACDGSMTDRLVLAFMHA